MSKVEIADLIRDHGEALAERWGYLPERVARAFRAMSRCRTAELGGHLCICQACGREHPRYNSCRNRHCPKCQGADRLRWVEARVDDVLPVPYMHAVLTVPAELRPAFRWAPRALYGLLFRSAWSALSDLAADPRHLGARIGALMVLHTWGRQLQSHPHVHCVIPAGGLDAQGQWKSRGERFFLPVRPLAAAFRNRFMSGLEQLVRHQEILLPPDLAESVSRYDTWLCGLRSRRWHVYLKPPFGGAKDVLRYLSRYTHRVAISNQRLIEYDGDAITFRYKDTAADDCWKTARVDGVEFLRRFAQHILPRGFVRIRYYGLLSNRNRRASVALIRSQLGKAEAEPADTASTVAEEAAGQSTLDRWTCPDCGGPLRIVERPRRRSASAPRAPPS